MKASKLEKELVEVTGIEASSYNDRQDFLAALVRGVDKLTGDEYDNVSDELDGWHRIAAEALGDKEPIPDPSEEPEVEELDDEAEAEDEAPESDDEAEPEAEPEEEKAPAKGKKGKAAKPQKEKPAKPAKAAKPAKEVPPYSPKRPDYSKVSGEKDRFGIIKGTKTASAVAMYVKGTTAKEIYETLGGRFYNILKDLEKKGHLVEKDGTKITLIHKDDIQKKPKGKGK